MLRWRLPSTPTSSLGIGRRRNVGSQEQLADLPERRKEQREEAQVAHDRTVAAAQAGDPAALMALGCDYFYGHLVSESRAQAVELWEKAAASGEPRAMLNLAVCLHNGYGVQRNASRALSLYERLAEQGYYDGLQIAAYCRRVGIGCAADNLAALHWAFELAKSGAGSEDFLYCLFHAKGNSELEREARAWVEDAARLGGSSAQEMVRILSEAAPPTQPAVPVIGLAQISIAPLPISGRMTATKTAAK